MSGIKVEGYSGVEIEVNANRELAIAPTRTYGNAGFVSTMAEHDSGDVTGVVDQMPLDSSSDYNLRVGLTTLFDNEVFNYAAQATHKHTYRTTNLTNAWAGGFMTTNASGITTLNSGSSFNTQGKFTLYGASDLWCECTGGFVTSWLSTNTTIDFGLFLNGTSTPFAPTDGVYFRVSSTGILGVSCYSTVEQYTDPFKVAPAGANWSPTLGKIYKFSLSVNERQATFWIDDIIMAILPVPDGTGQMMSTAGLPFSIRHAIGGTAASTVQQFKIATYTISMGDLNTNKLWSQQACEMGQSGYQGQSGGTMGSTSNITNSLAIPTTAAGSNTAANVTGLSGFGQMTVAAAAATDFIATSYLNTDSGTAFTGRKLSINGVRISASNGGAVNSATVPTTLMWGLAFSHTAVSLATAEGATTKLPRRIALGQMTLPINSIVGAMYDRDIAMTFTAPPIVNPGEYVATWIKIVNGAATASQTIIYTVAIDAHFV